MTFTKHFYSPSIDSACATPISSVASSTAFDSPAESPVTSPEPDTDLHIPFNSLSSTTASDLNYVLVIGGLGFIGSHTSLELLKAGYNVVIVDNLSNSYHNVLDNLTEAARIWCRDNGRTLPEVKFHNCDYNSKAMQAVLQKYSERVEEPRQDGSISITRSRITGVIHFAAFKSVSDSIARPLDYYDNNICGLVNLLRLLDQHGIHNFVFSSSATVYGTKADLGVPLKEEDIVHHPEEYIDVDGTKKTRMPGVTGLLSPYARTKYFGEAILADVAYSSPQTWNIIALRYFNPIGCDSTGLLGEDPKGVPTNLFPVITQVLTGDRSHIDVFGSDWDTRDGTAVRDFIHVSDLARGHIAAVASQSDMPFRTFNLGTGNGTTVAEAISALEEASGIKIDSRLTGRREGDVGSCVAENARAASELQWTPIESLAQCARDVWNYVSGTKRLAIDRSEDPLNITLIQPNKAPARGIESTEPPLVVVTAPPTSRPAREKTVGLGISAWMPSYKGTAHFDSGILGL